MNFKTDILLTFGVSVKEDVQSAHSPNMCRACFNKISKVKKYSMEGTIINARKLADASGSIWSPFSDFVRLEDCSVCCQFLKTGKGKIHWPRKSHSIQENTIAIDDARSTCHTETSPITYEHSAESTLDIRNNDSVLKERAQESETTTNIKNTVDSITTPTKDCDIGLRYSPPIATSTPTKPTKVMVDQMTSPAFKKDKLFEQSLEKSSSEPLTKDEAHLNTHFNRRLLYNSNNIIECKTGGQPLVLAKVTKPRKETSNVSKRTKRSRTQTMSSIRSAVAGSSQNSQIQQQTAELKNVDKSSRNVIGEGAGIKANPQMSSQTVMAMKEATDLSWSQLRVQRRFLKHAGLVLPNEQKQRISMKDLAATNIVTQMEDFEDGSRKKKSLVLCRVDNIKEYIFNMLDKHRSQNTLTWHGDKIPENEVWVKFGGDHGKNSLKFTMQIGNTAKPNSKHNTYVVAMAKIKDTYKNMKKCMSILTPQLEELSNSEWDVNKVKLFLFGDYELLAKL